MSCEVLMLAGAALLTIGGPILLFWLQDDSIENEPRDIR